MIESMIREGARNLGLPLDSTVVQEAIAVGLEAVSQGYDTDTAYSIARQRMVEAAMPLAS